MSEKVSLLVTDQWVGYRGLDAEYPYEGINHAKCQYVVGTFLKVSAKYLPPSVVEFKFRDNNRDNSDIFGEAIRGC